MQESISLGWNCGPAAKGVELGLRKKKSEGYKTCPFDMCNTNYDGVVLCLKEDFKYFCDPEYLTLIPLPSDILPTWNTYKGERLIFNTRYKFIFNHESPDHRELYLHEKWPGGKYHYTDNNFEMFCEKYNRRINNFRYYLENNSINFIISSCRDELNELNSVLKQKYPNLIYEIMKLPLGEEQNFHDEHQQLMNALLDEYNKTKCT